MSAKIYCIVTWCFALLLGTASAYGDTPENQKGPAAWDIEISGAVEVEVGYQNTDADDSSDITLATVELGIDVAPIRHVSAHILLLHEEDETDLEIDQGFIRLDGEQRCPYDAEAGQLYVPFGRFESHFISDPLTLELGEARETALALGYGSDRIDISLGMFNGDVNEQGESDDHIDGFVISAAYTLEAPDGLSLSAGASYISNLADSDGLTDQLAIAETVAAYVPGAAAFVSVDWKQWLFLKLEYVAAVEEFTAGDLAFDGGRDVSPQAVNAEVAYAISDRWECALRYGASEEAGDFLPESLWGAVVSYAPTEHIGLGLEIQTGTFEDDSDFTTGTLQLALEF